MLGPFDQINGSARSADLYVEDLFGRGLRRLPQPPTGGLFENYRARWTPDGRTIVFQRLRNDTLQSAIFAQDAWGGNVRQLTPWELSADEHNVSQGGRTAGMVAFQTLGGGVGTPEGKVQDVGTVPSDCPSTAACLARVRVLTDGVASQTWSFNPAWSPDGRRIVFSRFQGDALADLWTMNPDGSGLAQLTDTPDIVDAGAFWGTAPRRRW